MSWHLEHGTVVKGVRKIVERNGWKVLVQERAVYQGQGRGRHRFVPDLLIEKDGRTLDLEITCPVVRGLHESTSSCQVRKKMKKEGMRVIGVVSPVFSNSKDVDVWCFEEGLLKTLERYSFGRKKPCGKNF